MTDIALALLVALIVNASPFAAPPRIVATLTHTRAQQVDVSPDGTEIYVATQDSRGLLVNAASGEVHDAAEPPAWAGDYWRWKSGRANPANPSELISMATGKVTTVTTPEVGVGSIRESQRDPARAAVQGVVQLELRKTVIGTFADRVVPGLTFGWAPGMLGWMAYRDKAGRLAVIDPSRHVFVAPNTRDVWLPAWTSDGTRIVFAEQHGDDTILTEIPVTTTTR